MKKSILVCLISWLPCLVLANVTSPTAIANENMRKLSGLLGNWQLIVSTTTDGGKTWQTGEEQTVKLTLNHNGMLISEQPTTLTSKGFHMASFISYDQYRKVFRKAAIDDVWGIMDIYEGVIVKNTLIMTNLKSKTWFPINKTTWRAFRLSIDLNGMNQRQMLIEKSDDAGKSWQPAFKSVYKKLSAIKSANN